MHLIAHELLVFLVVQVAHRMAGCAPANLWGSWQAVAVDNLCTISELCGS